MPCLWQDVPRDGLLSSTHGETRRGAIPLRDVWAAVSLGQRHVATPQEVQV